MTLETRWIHIQNVPSRNDPSQNVPSHNVPSLMVPSPNSPEHETTHHKKTHHQMSQVTKRPITKRPRTKNDITIEPKSELGKALRLQWIIATFSNRVSFLLIYYTYYLILFFPCWISIWPLVAESVSNVAPCAMGKSGRLWKYTNVVQLFLCFEAVKASIEIYSISKLLKVKRYIAIAKEKHYAQF
jgi:hypothetical protein